VTIIIGLKPINQSNNATTCNLVEGQISMVYGRDPIYPVLPNGFLCQINTIFLEIHTNIPMVGRNIHRSNTSVSQSVAGIGKGADDTYFNDHKVWTATVKDEECVCQGRLASELNEYE
jgi:hypothetical protein